MSALPASDDERQALLLRRLLSQALHRLEHERSVQK